MDNGLRRDIVDESALRLIVHTKKRSTANQSGHPGVWYNKRAGRWEAYINFQKKRYRPGTFKITVKPSSHATGDDFNIALHSSLMAVSVTALVVLLLPSKKRKHAK